jgi:hypothetical protein
MNSDYILKGKGQLASQAPDWASNWASFAAAKAATQDADKTTADKTATDKTATNPTIRGSKKSFGPDVDTVNVTFDDLIDTINPLQHIPVVNLIYREITGEKISGIARVAGDALYGGAIGLVSGIVDAMFEQEKGKSVSETMVASVFHNDKSIKFDKKPAPETMLADNTAAPITNAPATDTPTHLAAQTKQPFGGVIASNQPETAPASIEPTALPTAHAPITVEGQKFYSMAGVIHRGGATVNMPLPSDPDVRLKSTNLKSFSAAKVPVAPNTSDNKTAQQLLGLGEPTLPLAAAPLSVPNLTPGFAPEFSGNNAAAHSLPPQLIEDMMLMNMQKYQNGLKNGNMRGATLDVEG